MVEALRWAEAVAAERRWGQLLRWLPPVAGTALFLPVALGVALGGPLPPGDGGLFYLMAQAVGRDLLSYGGEIAFSGMELPFAYPPLGFYLAAVLHRAGLPLEEAMRGISLAGTVLAVGAAGLLLRRLASSWQAALLAALLLVGLPRFWAGQLAGGGITRAPGLLFCLVAWLGATALPSGVRGTLLATGIGIGLAMLFHPEMGVYAAAGVVFLAVACRGERVTWRGALGRAAGACLVGALVCAPWWGTVLARHGPGVLIGAALGSQGGAMLRGLVPLLPPVYGEAEPWPVALLAMGGTTAMALRGRPLALAWALWLVLVDPRKGTVAASLPLALGGGEALAVLLSPLSRQRPALGLLTAGLALLCLWSAMRAPSAPSWPLVKVGGEEGYAMARLGEVLPGGETVMVLSGGPWMRDPWSDWGPALSGREFVLTVQGSEWLGPGAFGERRQRYQAVQECAEREDVECIARWVEELRPRAVWVAPGCRCPRLEGWLEEVAAGKLGGGVYILSWRMGLLPAGHKYTAGIYGRADGPGGSA